MNETQVTRTFQSKCDSCFLNLKKKYQPILIYWLKVMLTCYKSFQYFYKELRTFIFIEEHFSLFPIKNDL